MSDVSDVKKYYFGDLTKSKTDATNDIGKNYKNNAVNINVFDEDASALTGTYSDWQKKLASGDKAMNEMNKVGLQSVFTMLDKNGDGTISSDEVSSMNSIDKDKGYIPDTGKVTDSDFLGFIKMAIDSSTSTDTTASSSNNSSTSNSSSSAGNTNSTNTASTNNNTSSTNTNTNTNTSSTSGSPSVETLTDGSGRPIGTKETTTNSDGSKVIVSKDTDGKETSKTIVDSKGNAFIYGSENDDGVDMTTITMYKNYDVKKGDGQLVETKKYAQSYTSDESQLDPLKEVEDTMLTYNNRGVKNGKVTMEFNEDGSVTTTESSYNAKTDKWKDVKTDKADADGKPIVNDKYPGATITKEEANDYAVKLYSATKGLGTDNATLTKILEDSKLNSEDLVAIMDAYKDKYKDTLVDDINGEWFVDNKSDKLNKLSKALVDHDSKNYSEDKVKTNKDAEKIYESMNSTWSKSDAIALLNKLSGDDLMIAVASYNSRFGNLMDDLDKMAKSDDHGITQMTIDHINTEAVKVAQQNKKEDDE